MKDKIIELAKKSLTFTMDTPYNSLYLVKYIGWLTPYYSFIYLLCRKLKPDLMVELGTNCGMGAVHLALGNPEGQVFTIDEDKNSRKRLEGYSFFKDLPNIGIVTGYSYGVVNGFKDNSIDLLFIDGDHEYESVMKDYKLYLPKVKDNGIILIDDIQLSPDMERFWADIPEYKFDLNFIRPKDAFRPGRGCGFGVVLKGEKY